MQTISNQKLMNNKGVSLVVLIVIMLGIGLIGGAVASIMMSKQKSYPFALNSFKAYEIANAGAEIAIMYGKDIAFDPSDNTKITLLNTNLANKNFGGGTFTASYAGGTLTSVGTYSGVTRQVQVASFATYAATSASGDVSFDNPADMASFSPVESQSGQAIVVNTTTGVISLGQGATETYGAVWYGGNNTTGNCVNGSCDFDNGFRAYYVFQFATGSTGDGFNFAIINGTNNTVGSVGGDANMGELMAYGGDSRLYDGSGYINAFRGVTGKGLQPPKFATEFDIYLNTGCPTDPCGAGSRCDPSEQHMTYVFWGNNNTISCQDYYTRWLSSFSFLTDTIVYGTTGGNTYLYRSSAGTSGTTEPSWPSTQGATRSDNTITWTEYTWRPSQQYTLSPLDYVVPTTQNGHFYKVNNVQGTGSNKGKSSGSEPAWSTTTNWISPWDNNVKWQENGTINFATNSRTYDDNKHTAGTGTDTGNSSTGAGPTNTTSSNSYYTNPSSSTTWLADTGNSSTVNPKYAYRMEVVRNSGTRTYTIRSWIKTCTDGTANCDMYTNSTFGNVSTDYDRKWTASTVYSVGTVVSPTTANGHYYICTTAGTSAATQPAWPTGSGASVANGSVVWTEYGPFLERTITLDATYNTAFNKFLFGWTVATGAATQIADVRKFRMSFKP